MHRRIPLTLAASLWTFVAAAQPLPAPSAAASASGAPIPAPPSVSDPMLEPPSQPAKVVGSWREALAMVKARSVELQIALADIERTEQQGRQAFASLMPTLNGSMNASKQMVRTVPNSFTGDTDIQFLPPRANTYGAGLALSVPIIAPRAWYAQGTAEQARKVAQMSLREQRRVLAAAVANALVAVISSERVAELNRVGLRNSLERLVLTKRRAELGVANSLDVLRLEQDTNAARATILTGDENLRQARESLGLALGDPEAYGVPHDLNLDSFAKESAQACGKVNAVEERTDVLVARERVEQARRSHRDVELQFYPTVDLRSNYNLTLQPFFTVFGGSNGIPRQTVDTTNTLHSWTIAGVLSWNIFDGGIRYAQLRDTQIQVEQAEARVEQARRNASIEVKRTIRGVEVAEQARKIAEQSRTLAQETERLARVSFELGRGTSLELVDAARQLRQSEVQLALREFELVQSKIRALLALSNCDY
ncbi:MAG: TolC family protein [Polyangiaceae bacterium]|jgi:outer membrane protein TolC|nr:TolC family protein [Polyangiaceae bacterium]